MSTSIEQLPLAISLHNAAGHAVLNIPDAPQAMVLELTNRSADDLHTTALESFDPDDPHHHVRLSFRPGSLRGLDDIHVAPESSSAWRIHTFVAEDGTQVLSLRTVHRLAWSPGEVVAIRLGGVSADHRGGTRPSRVEAATSALVREADDGAVDVTGIQLLPLDIARSRVGAFDEARRLRSGSIATWGPITAGFPEGPGVVGNGQGLSTLRLRLVNTSSGPLHMSGDDDQASRIELGWRHGTPTAPWGLVGGSGDHITVTTYEPGQDEAAAIAGRAWRVDGPVLRCRWDHSWAPGEWLDVELDLHTGVPPGDTQVLVRFVDIPGLDDGELVLLAQVAPLATFPHGTVAVEPLDLWGARGALQFHGSDYLADEDVPHSTISLVAEPQDGDPGDHRLRIQSPSPVEITGGLAVQQDLDVGRELTVDGTATVNSTLRAQAGLHVTGPLRVTGPATVTSDMTARQDLRVGRELTVTRNLTVGGSATVTSDLTAKRDLTVTRNLQVDGTAIVTSDLTAQRDLTVTRNLTVTGTATVTKDLTARRGLKVSGGLTVGGTATVTRDLTAQRDLTIARDLKVAHTVWIGGTAAVAEGLSVAEDLLVAGELVIGEWRIISTRGPLDQPQLVAIPGRTGGRHLLATQGLLG